MMKNSLSPFQSLMVVVASFIVASVINIYPMGLDASVLRPMALIMVLIFWLIYKPNYVGVITAFAIGISSDLLLDTRLGQQAFAAVIMAFSIRFMGQYIKQLNLYIAWTIATIALIIFQLTLWAVQYLTQNIFFTSALFSLMISIVTWPLVFLPLISFVQRY